MIDNLRQKIPLSDATLLRLVILGGLAVSWLAIGYLLVRMSFEYILVATVAVPAALLIVKRPELGILGIVLTAALVRFSIGTGTQSRIVASLMVTMALVVLWVVRMLVVDRRLHLRPFSGNVPLLAFILTCLVSYLWGNAFRDPLVVVWSTWPLVQIGALAVMILLPGAFLLAANTIRDLRWLQWLIGVVVALGLLALVTEILDVRLSFLNTGGLFSLWFVSLTYSQALCNKRLPLWLRMALLALVGLWLYVYFIRRVTWLTGWLPSFVAITVISFIKSRRLFIVLVLLTMLYVGLNWQYYRWTVVGAESAESGQSRLAAWRQNWNVTGKHLLFGTGPAGYAVYYMTYFPRQAMATHSNYVDIASQTGIVGLGFCLWFFAALGWTGYRVYRRAAGSSNFHQGLAAAALAGWAGCMLAMGLGDWLFPFVYTQTIAGFDHAVYSWLLLSIIVILYNLPSPSGEVAHD